MAGGWVQLTAGFAWDGVVAAISAFFEPLVFSPHSFQSLAHTSHNRRTAAGWRLRCCSEGALFGCLKDLPGVLLAGKSWATCVHVGGVGVALAIANVLEGTQPMCRVSPRKTKRDQELMNMS